MRRENPALIRFFVRHPVASNLVMVMMIVFGLVGFTQINTQFFPTIERPTVVATFTWSGASAEDVEASILEAVEPELRFTDGLDDMESYAREGSGTVIMEFEDGHDMQKAQSDVEAVVSRITIFPDDMDDPVVSRTIVYETVAQISLSGPFPEGALRAFAQDIRDGLLDAGLDRVSLSGFRDEEILIEVPERELRRLDLNISQIGERIRVSTRDLPSGTLDGAIEKQVRALASSETLEAFRNVEVIARATGEKIRLRDIATVTTQFDPDQSINLEDGRQAIILNVQRSEAADTLESSRLVQDFVEAIKPTLPPTLTLSMSDVRAERLSERIMLLVENGGSGLLLVLLILFIFLNARIAFWVAFGIPVAFFATLGLMWVSGQTINMISLFGLIMTLGIVVDDAIVVGENTATRFAMGDSPIMAAENGAGAVTWPVVAAILTTQVAFFPLLLVDGRIGQIMGALPYVVIAVLFASLVECLLILPGHLRHAMPKNPKRPGWFRRNFDAGFIWFRDKPFGYLAKTAYHWRYTTIALAFGSLFIAAGVIASGKVGFQFFPSPEPESITANVVFTAGTPRETAMSALQKIEAALGPVEERLLEDARAAAEAGPQVEASLPTRITNSILSLVGIAPPDIAPVVQIETELVRSVSTTLGQAGRNRGDEFARIRVQLTPSEERSVRTRDITRAWRRAVPSLAGVERLAVSGNRLGPPGRDLDIQLIDAEPEVLKAGAEEVATLLAAYPGLSSINDNLPYGKPEIVLGLTPKGTALGFTIDEVGRQVRNAIEGSIAKRFARGENEITVRVQTERDGTGLQALREMLLRSPGGEEILLEEVVSMTEKRGFSIIQRRDGRPTVSVTADVDQDVITNTEIVALLADGPIPNIAEKYGINFDFSGRDEERRESFADLRFGLILALSVMYILLCWVFASYSRPLAIMLIIPFGFVGAVLGHMVMGFDLTILSLYGLLGLAGILVNDSIILVSRIDARLEEGQSLEDASVGAARDRLRAVLLTSMTTIGGLTPLLFEKSLQAQFLLPMAITIVFGLAVATLFVLFLVPALVGVGGDIGRIFRSIMRLYVRETPPAVPAE